ncbi:hypothetical protein [Methylobacterium oxalidis]|uniref:hypothetical protein n=1 Tax=Methylobacterium oxalidis TaxID=944322 RepID=UPI0033161499
MSEPGNTFKKAPKRKPMRGRNVAVSPEMREAYAKLIKEREQKEETYGRHLPQEPPRGR